MNTALMVIDIQNDYFPGGRMALDGMAAAATNCQALLNDFRARQAPVFIVQHLFNTPNPPFFAPDTHGAELHQSVAPTGRDRVIVKHAVNCFLGTELLQGLHRAGAGNLVICGAMSHMCVDAAVRAAADFGFQCTLAHDACATRALEFNGVTVPAAHVHAAFLAALSGAYARVVSTAEILQGLSEESPQGLD